MVRSLRKFLVALFALILVGSFVFAGCTRYANEKQLTTLDETQKAAVSAEQKVAEKEKEKAELKAKLAEKKAELEKVQAEKAKVKSKLGE